jgi:N6-adenosine-specific RNA methylase IME4
MLRFDIILSDCAWSFSDKLKMSDVKRSAEDNYSVMSIKDIAAIPVADIAEENSLLVSWVPSSLLQEGIEVMNKWGFKHKQTFIWVKTKMSPLQSLAKDIKKSYKKNNNIDDVKEIIDLFDFNQLLSFGMGRLFRQSHELALVGVRGKMVNKISNKSQRSVCFAPVTKHSEKPEELQNRIDLMYPSAKKIELFARRDRPGWTCVGNQCPSSLGEDIRESIERLKNQ